MAARRMVHSTIDSRWLLFAAVIAVALTALGRARTSQANAEPETSAEVKVASYGEASTTNGRQESAYPIRVTFNEHIRPILSNSCFQCHGPDETSREADLRLDQAEGISAVFAPGDLEQSDAWDRIISTEEGYQMPPREVHRELSDEEIALVRQWILDGAEWQGHWAFEPVVSSPVPADDPNRWSRNAIDRFILRRLNVMGLSPSPEADRERLIRRVTFDLTGLPPTIEEIDAFLADERPEAYEHVVRRLLNSSQYGERLALMWMDAARYGDSSVFHADGPRDMWPWRNWVIDAFNHNMPYDQFTVEQLAGDLLPDPTWQQLTASGFNRNHGTTDEGGAIDEEYRVEYIVDRIKTTSTVWMGLTMECAQCHDHKYDPISQEDYYRFFAFFNQSTDKGMQTRNGNAQPLIDVPNLVVEPRKRRVEQDLAHQQQLVSAYVESSQADFQDWLQLAASDVSAGSTLPTDCTAHWAFDEAEGDVVRTSGEESSEGKIHGGVQRDVGRFANGIKFNGNNYADLGEFGDFDSDQGFSFGGWVKYEANNNGAPIAKMDPGNNYRGWDIHLSGGRVEFHLIHHWPDNAIKVSSKKSIAADQWHHVMVTYDGSSTADGVVIYIDGQAEEWDIQQNGLNGTTRTDKPLYVGRRHSGSNYKGMVDEVRLYSRTLTAEEVGAVYAHTPLRELLAISAEQRTDEQAQWLQQHFLTEVDEQYPVLVRKQERLQRQLEQLAQPLSNVMVMRDLPEPRMTYILARGNYDSPIDSQPVEPAIPSQLGTLLEGAPQNRLGMAQWLVQADNPLTARVTVNRFWQMLFGVGLVPTAADFGAQGSMPSHPELLDWLAADFVQHDWDVKRTIEQIVLSATYRQSARQSPSSRSIDPENRWLSRGPRFRLQGEFIRDQALSVSGLLVERVGGPSVKPYQPPGLWNEVSLSGNVRFVQDHGYGLYRRSMYTYWKRSAPAPSLILFDAPTREKCVVQRAVTNTPMQALVTLNDIQFVESARMLAERMLLSKAELTEQIALGHRLLTGRRPTEATMAMLVQTFEQEQAMFAQQPEQANALLAAGEHPRDETIDVATHASMTIVASILLNLDETLTRN